MNRGTRKKNRPSNTKFNPRRTIRSNDDVFNADIPDMKPKPPVWTTKKGHLKRERRRNRTLPTFEEEEYEGGKNRRRTRKTRTRKRKGRKGKKGGKGRKTYRRRR